MNNILIFSFLLLSLFICFWSIIDLSKTRLKGTYTNTWFLFLVILIPVFGSIVYFLVKRKLQLPKRRFAPNFRTR